MRDRLSPVSDPSPLKIRTGLQTDPDLRGGEIHSSNTSIALIASRGFSYTVASLVVSN